MHSTHYLSRCTYILHEAIRNQSMFKMSATEIIDGIFMPGALFPLRRLNQIIEMIAIYFAPSSPTYFINRELESITLRHLRKPQVSMAKYILKLK